MTKNKVFLSHHFGRIHIAGVCLMTLLPQWGCSEGTEAAGILSKSAGLSCITDDEYDNDFSGFSTAETVISSADECGSDVCLVRNFQGRVSCPDGQLEGGGGCETPEGIAISVPVQPQLSEHPGNGSVFCSCRCDGEGDGPFCACPRGLACTPVVEQLGISDQLAGSYCVPE